jgi:hypothetical protein
MIVFAIMLIAIFAVSISWAEGLNKMNNEYPDYDGKDMFDED